MPERKKRMINVAGTNYDGVRTIVREVIKRAGLTSYTYEDIILAADGPLSKFAPYLTDRAVQRCLWGMQHRNIVKRCGTRGTLAVYCASRPLPEISPEIEVQDTPTQAPENKMPDTISAEKFGDLLIRYIEILKQKVHALESDLANERHLHGKALEALKGKHIRCDMLEKENKELSEKLVAINKVHQQEASKSTFKLQEIMTVK